ncbi:MAG: MptD family putative ECF transporter S component [Tissierellia bacterium]|nr:MptD family putative ECF transporter S component [Tissierellia bacterium]
MSNNLEIKDLITIGIFSVIYIFIIFVVGMLGTIPILFLFYPAFIALVAGIVIMLFMAKVPKKWALFILATIPAILFVIFGHTYFLLIHAILFNLIAEFIFRKGEFKSFKHNAIAYAFMSLSGLGGPMQMLFVRDKYFEILSQAASEEYILLVERLITYPNMLIMYLLTFVAAIAGAFIGKKILKKHFVKAGII